MIDKVKIWLG